jgi:hypothetical protein
MAEAMLARRIERRAAKDEALRLAFERDEQRTNEHLRRLDAQSSRVSGDLRLAAFLELRAEGRTHAEALAEVERRFGPDVPSAVAPT